MRKELIEALKKLRYFFTKEYQEECAYIEFKQKMRDQIKLKCECDESIDDKIQRLIDMGYTRQK